MTAIWRNLLILTLLGGVVCAQQVPLGDVARQLRAHKKPPAHVITNDDLPSLFAEDGHALGSSSSSSSSSSPTKLAGGPAKAGEATASNAAKASPVKAAGKTGSGVECKLGMEEAALPGACEFSARYAAQRKSIDQEQSKLGSLQHDYDLQTSQYWTDAGTQLRNGEQWTAKRKQLEADIAAQQLRLQLATEKLDEIREQARRAGLPLTLFGE